MSVFIHGFIRISASFLGYALGSALLHVLAGSSGFSYWYQMPATVPSLSPHHPTPLVNFTQIRPSEVMCPFSPVHWGGRCALIG